MMLAAALASATLPRSTPDLGLAEGRCRRDEPGPAFIIDVTGLKDRKGLIRVELYPADDRDFLADDNVLIAAGKPFARVERPVPQSGPVELCIRAPAPGSYALSLLHDRDGNRKFGLSTDGVGFPGNPRIGLGKPHAAQASAEVGTGIRRLSVRMNYRRGLFSFGPVRDGRS
ncbi:DUF2141 domain-containing protein [Sphingomonas sp. MAH-20]|uniref:DUF2141 domain-containing protein n=1 Tax=Sphingomonas horti TaxID=2682842 RepID=A0A6I4IXB8_9SPHN|nr:MULTISPECIES: DUF2141 domain-containing protein [Sphingomonas]MBA2920502.1 DUF2141 domain-containing protein [Sphingomonas sp. CGMCC 1.13658]MVO76754.1 DUF2141 domain-containing protein [Sphingomonas horti]